MKNKDIAICGLMISVYAAIGFVFNVDMRAVQTYAEILKTAIIAVCIRKFISSEYSFIFLGACFIMCLFVLPIHQTIIYNVPCFFSGYIIGKRRKKDRLFKDFFVFFCVNTLMTVYEFILYNIIVGINLFSTYREGLAGTLQNILGITISPIVLNAFFMLSILVDSIFSSIVIYAFSIFVIRQLDRIIGTPY